MDCSYQCTKATILENLGVDATNDRLLFCRLEFQNEHGHAMQDVEAIVVLRSYGATIVHDAGNILDDTLGDAEWDQKATALGDKLVSGDVGFDIHNQEEVAENLAADLETGAGL